MLIRYGTVLLILCISVTVIGCAGKKPAEGVPRRLPAEEVTPGEQPPPPQTTRPGPEARAEWQQTGLASWYGSKYHNRRTANGERYNMHAMTAAHKSLPFGTVLQVTNLENGKTCKVRINDRGPFVEGRIIDLSYAAARKIDMVRAGVVRVRIVTIGNK